MIRACVNEQDDYFEHFIWRFGGIKSFFTVKK